MSMNTPDLYKLRQECLKLVMEEIKKTLELKQLDPLPTLILTLKELKDE